MSYSRTILIVLIMTATWGLTLWAGNTEDILPVASFERFPVQIGSWQGIRGELDPEVYNVLGVEDYVLANFRKPPFPAVNLYIGFYQSQRQGDIIHSPRNCLPGAGWRIARSDTEVLSLGSGTAQVARLFLEKGAEKQVVLYWFQSRGRIISSEYMQKIWLVIDAVTRHRTDGSFVRLIAPVVRTEQETLDLLRDFARQLHPHLEQYIPS